MLTDFEQMWGRYNIRCTGIIHAGAHLGEEAKTYHALGCRNVWWIEANPKLIAKLTENVTPYGQHVVNAVLSDTDGETIEFHITNNGMSSSLLELETHKQEHPDVWETEAITVTTQTMDSIAKANPWMFDCNFLNMDLQGAELLCLKGATEILENIDYIYTEVNWDHLYKDCVLNTELYSYLDAFTVVDEWRTVHNWGDALLIRNGVAR